MAPPSSDAADSLFWKAYGAAIQKAVGQTTVNDTTSFYLSTQSQRGPPGGDNIAASFTNEGFYNLGNNLLPPDQLFYSPSSMNSYIQQLATYLSWVDVGGHPSAANVQAVTNALVAQNASQEGANKALDKALADFKKQKEAGLVGDQNFAQWAPMNAFAYNKALSDYRVKSTAYQKAMSNAYGALADAKAQDDGKLIAAQDTITSHPGFNMDCGLGTPPSAAEINNALTAGDKLKDPNTVLRPMYECPSYISVVKEAQMEVGSDRPTKNSFTLQSSQGSDVSESQFNHSAVSGGVSFSYWPWVSFSASGSSSTDSSSVSTESFAQQVSITVNYDSMSLVPINPSGSWDIGDVRTKYPKLLEGAPKSVKTLVKPTMLVLATRLGYTVEVGSAGSKSFDSMCKKVESGGGSMSILGIPCSFGIGASSSSETVTHQASWDSTNGKLEVKPTDNCGFATIVGLIGEKIVTA